MRVASVQMNVVFGNAEANALVIELHLRELAGRGVQLAVFPEAALTGYCFDSKESAFAGAIERSSAALMHLQTCCDSLDIGAAIGFAEREDVHLFNSAVFLEPGQLPRFYRKTHLPHLGLDRFVDRGDELTVWDTKFGRIGLLICFDMRFPEAARTLALGGADLILLPTNWPIGAIVSADHIAIARAAESSVYLITCNRVGTEGGFHFIGHSKIIDPSGRVLAEAGDGEAVLTADIDLSEARQKRKVILPGEYELEIFGARRPDLYRL